MASSRTELMFGHQDALTLDDIPRIVAAEQAKEQRPNAYKHARHELFRTSMTEPKLQNGHGRSFSTGNQLDQSAGEPTPQRREGTKKYFSELSALEYFIVRHVAVIAMQPMLEGHFTMEELLNLIETRKPTFWNKMGKGFPKGMRRREAKRRGSLVFHWKSSSIETVPNLPMVLVLVLFESQLSLMTPLRRCARWIFQLRESSVRTETSSG